MTYLLDSDCLIDFLKGKSTAVAFVTSTDPASMFFSLISYGEVIQGILFGREVERRTEEFERLVDQLELVGLDPETMRIFATLRGSLEREGLRLPDFDLLIAATALRHDHTLVSRNLGHFNRIPNLRLVTPGS